MKNSSYICSFFLLLLFTFNKVYANVEVKALMELKASLDPTNNVLTTWTSNADPCSSSSSSTGSFEGVACNEHRKVANISLQGKGLTGTISPAVAKLKCLTGLYLHFNSLTGEVPKEIANLTELSDLYLNVNNLSGSIPPEIGKMRSLQVLQLCCNQLTDHIPTELGSLKNLIVLALQYNRLTGEIPSSLSNLTALRRLDLSFNKLYGTVPAVLASSPQLQVFDVRNNSLIGVIPSGFKKLGEGFQSQNNPGLCGIGFSTVRACTSFDNVNTNQMDPFGAHENNTSSKVVPPEAVVPTHTNRSKSSNILKIAVISGVTVVGILLAGSGMFTFLHYRRQKQKLGNVSEISDRHASTDLTEEFSRNGASPIINLDYYERWTCKFSDELLNSFKFNLKEIETATQYFSRANLLGKSSFSSVYKGILRDGSIVAIRSINATSCKTEEEEFVNGLNLLTSLRHENLINFRGFCYSKERNECYLIYDFALRGRLSKYLDIESGSERILDWSSRVFIIDGIARGLLYLHSNRENKPVIIYRNISVEKILIDRELKPMIADSGLHNLLADDFVFSALKNSAAMGYMAPEYVMTGRFTEKTDIFAFGVIILQILSGKCMLTSSTRLAAESGRPADFVDSKLLGNYSELEAMKLGKLAITCTQEHPDDRPRMEEVTRTLTNEYRKDNT